MADQGEIFIGNKPFMNYVTAAILQFHSGAKEVVVKARGRYISKAVDVVEYIRSKVMPNLKVKDIQIGSEEFKAQDKEGKERTRRVSWISITIGQ